LKGGLGLTLANPLQQEQHNGFQLLEKAPDFCAAAYQQNQETQVCLNAYVGKWLVLFFYSSDFSFV
jgi:peroxiredoxin (alkyl hydroperoxide reductase subunit C)